MRQHGKIVKWFDDKGYGFVSVHGAEGTDGAEQQVFVHISAFQKQQNRPEIGEEITFEIVKDSVEREQARDIFFINRPMILVPEVDAMGHFHQETQHNQPRMKISPRLSRLDSGRDAYQGRQRKRSFKTLIYMIVFSLLALKITEHLIPELRLGYQATTSQAVPMNTIEKNQKIESESNAFQCDGKTRCTEMTSCDEATFYLKNCPGTLADGDGDGVPCEDQWCDH